MNDKREEQTAVPNVPFSYLYLMAPSRTKSQKPTSLQY